MSGNQLTGTHHITKDDLLFLLKQNDSEILQKLQNSAFGFFIFLEKRRYAGNDVVQILEMVIKILSQVCSLRSQRNVPHLNRLLRMLKSCEKFLYDDIPRVINSCFTKSHGINLAAFMEHYMNILITVLSKDFFPCQRIVSDIFPALENYMNRLHEKKFRNLESIEACFKNLARWVENYQNPTDDDDDDCEMNTFRNLSVVPRSNEIVNYEVSNVPQNIIDRPYKSVDHYLSVYYRLTREDMLRSFRECVNLCISNSGQGFSVFSKSRYYENVTVVSSPKYTKDGICYNIIVRSSIEIDWGKKEVLLPGSLVFLTPNSFKTVIFATVIKNPKVSHNKTKECKLLIKLEDDLFVDELTDNTDYAMIEPSAYFECYKHVLKGLKDFNEANFPLSDILVYFDYEDPVPEYLDNKKFCLHEKCGSSAKHDSTYDCKNFHPLKQDEWPEIDSLKLDDQQYLAFKTALTKKVTVIQGPPGTGKTHVGRKVVQTLLDNSCPLPIVICCLTNHALDQFLEGIIKEGITKKVVRLGSQSKSEILKPYTMENLMYAIRQYHQGNTVDEALQKSLDLVEDFASILLQDKMLPAYDAELNEILKLCKEINANVLTLSLCKDKYLDDSALNDIIDSEYKEKLRISSGSIEKSLSSSVLEWLGCSRSSDLYDKCQKYFCKFDTENTIVPKFQDVWELAETKKRFKLFYCWRKMCLEILKNTLEENLVTYKNLMRQFRYKPVESEKLEIVKGAFIIGVTTTGACKFKDLIQCAKPRIIIIEEAAQVLESHVIASLVPSMQHLILIGDHEQLRPLPTNYELSEKYNLKISMFERLFRNGAPSVTLVSQHRMKPCIAELLVPRPYTHYTSSDEVYKYEEIRGVHSSVFFFDHREPEDVNSSGTSSTNNFEARMIASLAKYFSVLSYRLDQMTILTTYAAQVGLIQRYLVEKELLGIHVTTVDNFQGEENDIILLSFVRSNPTTIGFLKESNRVCVALSRAKKGLFCFGNFELFAHKNDLWKDIIEKIRIKNMIDSSLLLKCDRHQTIQAVKCEEDILSFFNEGCSEMCNFVLPCKHKCVHTCHFNDPEHLHYPCKQPCERMMDEKRVCPRLCWERCKKVKKKEVELPCGHFGPADNFLCFKEIQRLLPCEKHIITVPCHMDIQRYECKARINRDLECGHSKRIFCYEQKKKMNIICTELRPETGACGHVVNVLCYLHLDENDIVAFCNKACGVLLDCGHPCVRFCCQCFDSGIHGLCREKCEFVLSCGHKCQGYCNSPCPPCKDKCFIMCPHGTQCINECLRPCVTCEEPCERVCKHNRCSKKCCENCNVEPCMQPCSEILSCGHQCIGLCGDPCPYLCRSCNVDDLNTGDAENSLYVQLECNHVIEVNELMGHVKNCLEFYEWPSCPECSRFIIQTVRYKEAVMKAKEFCIKSCDTSETISDILYLVDSIYGINCIVPAPFRPIDKKIKYILKIENLGLDALFVLKNCIILLKKMVDKQKFLKWCDERVQSKFDTLLLWIFHHLTSASFQQLKELDAAVTAFSHDISRKCILYNSSDAGI